MLFKTKLLAYSVATSIMLATSPVLTASPVVVDYRLIDSDSAEAKELWDGVLPYVHMMSGGKPAVNVASYDLENGSKLRITTIYASDACDMNSCPIRVFEDDKLIDEFRGCDNIGSHYVADSHRAMVACEDVFIIHRK